MKHVLTGTLLLLMGFSAHSQVSTDDMNASNNPLTPVVALNLHDYIASSVFGTDDTSNAFNLRIASPMMLGGVPQLARMTIPYQTVPDVSGDQVSGVGDISIFDLFLMGSKEMQLGVGPLVVLPTASKDETGAGKWQLGAAGVLIAPRAWGMFGALITYQHDISGDSERATQNIATAQPFFIYNLPESTYLRSAGIWYFNWETGDYYIPIGFGAGKVWKLQGGTTINFFIEPQWTVAHEGVGVPNYQTFVGLNFQFPLK